MTGQSKRHSRIEAGVGTIISFLIGVGVNLVVLPPVIATFGLGLEAAVVLTLSFMGLSYIRQYYLRRFFNWYQLRTSREAQGDVFPKGSLPGLSFPDRPCIPLKTAVFK